MQSHHYLYYPYYVAKSEPDLERTKPLQSNNKKRKHPYVNSQNGPTAKKKHPESNQLKDPNKKDTTPGSVLSDLDKIQLERWLKMQKQNVLTKTTPPQQRQQLNEGLIQQIAVVKSQHNQHGGEQEENVKGQKIINRVNSNIKTFTNLVPKIEGIYS